MARTRRRFIRRFLVLGTIGGLLAYRRQRLDAADRAFPEALPKARAAS
jgi:hypothetical protein